MIHPDTLERAVRIAAENLARDSAHIPHIEQTIRKAITQAESEAPADIVAWIGRTVKAA